MLMKVTGEQSKHKMFTEAHLKILVTIRMCMCASFDYVCSRSRNRFMENQLLAGY
jgi:hypothetical protein